MRRLAPRPVGLALAAVMGEVSPASTLASVQACWPAVAGPVVGAEAWPVGEREGIVAVSCRSAVWAQELALLSEDLLARINTALAAAAPGRTIVGLRFDSRAIVPK